MTQSQWDTLLTQPENQWFDRKSLKIKPADLAKTIIALANTEGGIIALGIQDKKAQGLPTQKQMNAMRQAAFDYTDPTVHVDFKRLEGETEAGTPAQIWLLEIAPSPNAHINLAGEAFVRNGDKTQKLSASELIELRYSKGDQQYDRQPVPGATQDDLDWDLVTQYANRIGSSSAVDALHARGMLSRDETPVTAAILLFGKAPQNFFPHARVRVLKWLSNERLAGRHQMLQEDRQFDGTLPHQIACAQQYIEELLPQVNRLGHEGLFEGDSPIPRDAWLEALVNAVIHRSYSFFGDHIRFEIFPNRIEVTSPGRFPGVSDPTRPESITRFARNPIIARVAAELNIGQELGEGIRRIFYEMRSVGFEEPSYTQTSGTVTLTLSAHRQIANNVTESLPPRSHEVLETLRRAGKPLGTGEVALAAGISVPVARRALKSLRKEKLVIWEGNSPRDPRATWSPADPF